MSCGCEVQQISHGVWSRQMLGGREHTLPRLCAHSRYYSKEVLHGHMIHPHPRCGYSDLPFATMPSYTAGSRKEFYGKPGHGSRSLRKPMNAVDKSHQIMNDANCNISTNTMSCPNDAFRAGNSILGQGEGFGTSSMVHKCQKSIKTRVLAR